MFWGRRFGAVYPTWLGRRYVYLLGPEANEFVFANDGLFRVREAFRGLIPVDGPTALIVTDGPDHARRRALVRPSLHHRQVAGYVETMVRTADEALPGSHRAAPSMGTSCSAQRSAAPPCAPSSAPRWPRTQTFLVSSCNRCCRWPI
ncbi:hypothetical protein CGZ95_08005 [Enemella evansiae]|nr:hypothetical protein CGZ95_08005 [Enemella evansiae]